MSKYYILSSDEPTYDLLYDVCAESDDIAAEEDPYILLDSKEYASFLRAQKAYNKWQDKLDWIIHEHNKKINAKPREPFGTMDDYKKEIEEFLK
jgi:hypothetical protein